jgi:DNA-binding response OmpR family regulator
MSRSVLACWGCAPPLLDLLRGTAANLNLEFREMSGLEEIRGFRGIAPSVVVIAAPDLANRLLSDIKSAASVGMVWPVVVIPGVTSQGGIRAMEAGAICCFDSAQAMAVLAYLVRNLLRFVRHEEDAMPKELPIALDVTLRIPEYILTNRHQSSHLTPVAGRLLECLVSHAGTLVPPEELKRAAWGSTKGAENHTLHQQVHRLRTLLMKYDIGDRLRCLRGKGYILTSGKTQRNEAASP